MKKLLKLIGYSNQFRKPQTPCNFDIVNYLKIGICHLKFILMLKYRIRRFVNLIEEN